MEINTKLQMLRNALPGKEVLKIGIWGDSILQGVVLDEVKGRYCIIKDNAADLCSQMLKVTVENYANFGCTAIKGKLRLRVYLDRGGQCDVAILEFGSNDCDMPWKEISANPETDHSPKVPLETFSTLLQDMISALISHGVIPIMTTLPPLNHERYLNWVCRSRSINRRNILRYIGNSYQMYRTHEQYSYEISKVATENNCRVVDIRTAFLDYGKYRELICIDGIHPNEKGQMLIRDTFIEFVGKYMPALKLLEN